MSPPTPRGPFPAKEPDRLDLEVGTKASLGLRHTFHQADINTHVEEMMERSAFWRVSAFGARALDPPYLWRDHRALGRSRD